MRRTKINLIRLDQFLFFIRVFKSRNVASNFISNGKVTVNGLKIKKPHKRVNIGDILTLEKSYDVKIIEILKIPSTRVSFTLSLDYYENKSTITVKEKKTKIINNFVSRIGRPTKLDRRKIDKLMGRN